MGNVISGDSRQIIDAMVLIRGITVFLIVILKEIMNIRLDIPDKIICNSKIICF